MAKKHQFPASVVIAIGTMTTAFMFSVYAKDEGITDLMEIPVSGYVPFMAYKATITSEWYNAHKAHKNIKIMFND